MLPSAFPETSSPIRNRSARRRYKASAHLLYDVTFPLFAKIEVNGNDTHPLYKLLKKAQPGLLGSEAIKWNFTKFLVSRDGQVLKRYAPSDTPEKIEADLKGMRELPTGDL